MNTNREWLMSFYNGLKKKFRAAQTMTNSIGLCQLIACDPDLENIPIEMLMRSTFLLIL